MSVKSRYKIVTAETPKDLVRKVNEAIQGGYKPTGGLITDSYYKEDSFVSIKLYRQAMFYE